MNAGSGFFLFYYFQTEHAHKQKQNHHARSNASGLNGCLKKGETKNLSSSQQLTLPLFSDSSTFFSPISFLAYPVQLYAVGKIKWVCPEV